MGWREKDFKKIDGGHASFPYGPFSRGYIVDDAKKAELIAFIERQDCSLAVIVIAAAAGWWIAGTVDGAWLGAGLLALPFAVYHHLTAGACRLAAHRSRE